MLEIALNRPPGIAVAVFGARNQDRQRSENFDTARFEHAAIMFAVNFASSFVEFSALGFHRESTPIVRGDDEPYPDTDC